MKKNGEANMRKRYESWIWAGIIFFIIVGLFVLIQAASGLYPFGSKTNLLWDEEIQYVDFFAYYRDVLLGKAKLGYSFSKSAGGSLVALFGYYLELHVLFLSKSDSLVFPKKWCACFPLPMV